MNKIPLVAISMTIGLIAIAYGQEDTTCIEKQSQDFCDMLYKKGKYNQTNSSIDRNVTYTPNIQSEIERCTISESAYLVILQSGNQCYYIIEAMQYYASKGYEIKAVDNSYIYLQKSIK